MNHSDLDARNSPLVVPLEGVLLRTNFGHERAIHAVSSYIFSIPYRIKKLTKNSGWNAVKKYEEVSPASLLYNDNVLDYIHTQREKGRDIFLVSRLPADFVQSVSNSIGAFSGCFVLDRAILQDSDDERAALREKLGPTVADFELLSQPMPVSDNPAVDAVSSGVDLFSTARAVISAIRVRQWSKNILIFVPTMLSPESTSTTWFNAALAFFAFSFIASISYIFNDLLDLQADRIHPSKRTRPFASGALPVASSAIIVPALFIGALLCGIALPLSFNLILVAYFVLTCLYSVYLKRMLMIDVVALGCLYAVRIVAGGEATGIVISEWLIAFSVFLFLSLALIKRQAELATMRAMGRERAGNRSYITDDFYIIGALAASAAFNAVTVFAVFISFEMQRGIYEHPRALWLAIPVLIYWLARVIILTSRGKMDEDPIVFAATDLKSIICGVAMLIIIEWAH
jgi:4-hydroxybenzoate polyprenyltransferase